MTLKYLKENLDKLSDDLIIFLAPQNYFIADEYVNAIIKRRGGECIKIEDLSEALSLFDNGTYLLKTDKFDFVGDYSEFKNTIVVCKEIDTKVLPQVRNYVVEIPVIQDWQAEEYIKTICPEIAEEAKWFYENNNKDIYQVKNELDKITLFNKEDRYKILADLKNENYYFSGGILDFVDALILRDAERIKEYLLHGFSPAPMQVVYVMLSQLLAILDCGFSSDEKAKEHGYTQGRIYTIRKKYQIPLGRIMKDIDIISSIEGKLRNGVLDVGDKLLDYILVEVL